MSLIVRLVLISLLSLSCSLTLFAKTNADFIIVVDQSRSVKQNLPAIKDFIAKRIFSQIAHDQDTIHLLSFDGQLYEKKRLKGSADIFDIGYALDSIQAVGKYTDITKAVVKMSEYIEKKTDSENKKIIFFITDGLNEPPQYSPYPEKLDSLFFAQAINLKKSGGWEIFVAGIGSATSAPELAQILTCEYVEIDNSPSLQDFDTVLSVRLKAARERSLKPYIVGAIVFAALSCFAAVAVLKRS